MSEPRLALLTLCGIATIVTLVALLLRYIHPVPARWAHRLVTAFAIAYVAIVAWDFLSRLP